ncbi:MAG: hypothetical protein IT449_00345 [Phycisphaerales bacterium]|nr:hypothetical protein [Phycisphaerales bacterium]
MSQSVSKNIVMTVILVAAVGGILWRWSGTAEERRPPATPESRTVWVCEKCGHTVELTARELSDARQSARLSLDSKTKGPVTSTRETYLLCPQCKENTMVCGIKCIQCGKGILADDSNLCADCAKAARGKPTPRG